MKTLYYIIGLGLLVSLFTYCSTSKGLNYKSLLSGTWTEIIAADQTMPVERHEAAFIGIGERMYLLGGRDIRPVSIYDKPSNTWSQGAKPPIEMHHFQPFVYQGEIYVAGAMTGGYPGETPIPDIYIYSPGKDTWRKGPQIPADRRRGGAGAVIDGDNLYIVCGIKDGHRGDHKKWLDLYNFSTGTWTILPDAPRPRDHFQSVIHDGKLYAIAGRTTIAADNPFKNTIKDVDVYDISSHTWSTLDSELPTERAGTFCTIVDDEILVIGGESFNQNPAHAEVEALHTKTEMWRSLPNLPIGRHGTGCVNHEGALYIASGCGNRGGSPELTDFWKYEL